MDGGELPDPGGYGGIPKDRHARHVRRDLLEQLQPFPAKAEFEIHEPGGVAARPRQAIDEAGGDRIGDGREHDRHRAGRLQQRRHGRGAVGKDDIGRERRQFRRVSANVVGIGRGPAGVDPHVAADGPARLRQLLQERPHPGLKFRIVRGCGQEHADAPHPVGLLCTRRERPDGRGTCQRNKLASPHRHPKGQGAYLSGLG